eukprot:4326200-Prymnesium_polylepis.2
MRRSSRPALATNPPTAVYGFTAEVRRQDTSPSGNKNVGCKSECRCCGGLYLVIQMLWLLPVNNLKLTIDLVRPRPPGAGQPPSPRH